MSSTAAVIAASTALAAREPGLAGLLEEGDAALADAVLAESGPRGKVLLTLLANGFVRAALIRAEGLLLPGIQLHYRARKRRIASLVESEVSRGTTQVVIAGAGYDGLGARVARRHSETRVFELDRPGVLRLKQRAHERAGLVPGNLHNVIADLTAVSLVDVLATHRAFIGGEPTVVVAEGLLMYLDEAEVMTFLDGARNLTKDGGKVIFTVMDTGSGRPRFHREHPLVAWWLARSAEPFRWGVSPREVAGCLTTRGLALVAVHGRDALREELGLSGDEEVMLAEGEYVVVAEPRR